MAQSPTCQAYAYAPLSDPSLIITQPWGTPIRCTLALGHPGDEHEDHSNEHNGEVICWKVTTDALVDAITSRLDDPEFRCSYCGENTTACAQADVLGGPCGA